LIHPGGLDIVLIIIVACQTRGDCTGGKFQTIKYKFNKLI
jgi:hypothetical protein